MELIKGQAFVVASMYDAGHLTKERIEEIRRTTQPHLVEAVIYGNPTMGAGNVYQVPRVDIEYDYIKDSKGKYIEVPPHWRRIGGLDLGFTCTAFVALALDPDTDVLYVIDEHFVHQANPILVAAGIKHRKGNRYPIITDHVGTDQSDGKKLIQQYRAEGLDCRPANKAVEAGIDEVWKRLSTGRLKIFKHCTNLFREYEMYQRNIDGKIVKKNDHGLDALRYAVMGLKQAKTIFVRDTDTTPYTNPYKF